MPEQKPPGPKKKKNYYHIWAPYRDRARKRQSTRWKQAAFLQYFSECGVIAHACKRAGISRSAHDTWKKHDPKYKRKFEEAKQTAIDVLEKEAWRRASEGIIKPVFYKGKAVGGVKEYSDGLLMFLLKGYRPKRFRDNQRIEHTGPDGGPVQVDHDPTKKIEAALEKMSERLGFQQPPKELAEVVEAETIEDEE